MFYLGASLISDENTANDMILLTGFTAGIFLGSLVLPFNPSKP
jgi:hypothetical protein